MKTKENKYQKFIDKKFTPVINGYSPKEVDSMIDELIEILLEKDSKIKILKENKID